MSKTVILAALLVAGSALSVTSSADAAAYTFTQIDVPFAGASDTNILGINDLGQVVGSYRDAASQLHGSLRDAAGNFSPIDVPFPDANNTTAYGLNNQGEIVGSYNIGGPAQNLHGFVLRQGQFQPIDVPFPAPPRSRSSASMGRARLSEAISAGRSTAFWTAAVHSHRCCFLRRQRTGPTGSTIRGKSSKTSWIRISRARVCLGERGFSGPRRSLRHEWDRGIWSKRPGQIVGDHLTADFIAPIHGFLLDAGVFTTIDVPFPDSFDTVIRGIDSRGDLAGLFFDAQGTHGFIASPQAAVPEPSSGTLLGFAIAALLSLLGGSKLVMFPVPPPRTEEQVGKKKARARDSLIER